MDKLIPINFNNEIVITTKTLAEVYECKEQQITQNFNYSQDKFEEKKHYYKLQGKELKEFKRLIENSDEPLYQEIKFAPVLILWTKRGASRHCKMLGTDKAWDMFDSLEENYFNPKVPQLTRKQELQLRVINAKESDRLIALGEYTDYIEIEARKPLEEKLNFIIKNATTIDEFQRIMCCFINAIAKKTNTNSQTVYANLYDFLKKKEGIDLYARCRNAKNKAQQERIAQGKKPYSEATLQKNFSIKSTIKENEYEKILFIIKAKAIEEGLTIEELNKSIKFYIEEIA